jgi:hypothetical protein
MAGEDFTGDQVVIADILYCAHSGVKDSESRGQGRKSCRSLFDVGDVELGHRVMLREMIGHLGGVGGQDVDAETAGPRGSTWWQVSAETD